MTKNHPSVSSLRFAVLAVDTALFTIRDGQLYVRLTRIERPPHFVHAAGLPGSLIHADETADEASTRNLNEKAHIDAKKPHVEQLYTFSAIDRDPRNRVVAVAYLALVPWEKLSEDERADSESAWWSPVTKATKLAFDHSEILATALKRLRSRVSYTTVISKLLPHEFTLTELEKAYASILNTDLDKRNFRKKILKLQVLKELPHKRSGGRFRPAQLYAFVGQRVAEMELL